MEKVGGNLVNEVYESKGKKEFKGGKVVLRAIATKPPQKKSLFFKDKKIEEKKSSQENSKPKSSKNLVISVSLTKAKNL